MVKRGSPSAPEVPKKWLPADQRRQSLLDAGWALLAEGGPRAVSIDAVVARAGISRPIFYRHFTDRIDLLVALYRSYGEEYVRLQESVLLRDGGSIEELRRATLVLYFDLVASKGVVVRPLVEAANGDPRMEAVRRSLREQHAVLWRAAVLRRVSPEVAEVLLSDDHVRRMLTVTVELAQALVSEATSLWLSGRVGRAHAEGLVMVMLDGLTERVVAFLTNPEVFDPLP
jgi:AcrR family transcriptional regulator